VISHFAFFLFVISSHVVVVLPLLWIGAAEAANHSKGVAPCCVFCRSVLMRERDAEPVPTCRRKVHPFKNELSTFQGFSLAILL
jgi:hypothetical protein